MKTKKKSALIFLILVPHRDIRTILYKYGENLQKNGFPYIHRFPCVIPAALLSDCMENDELRDCAHAYRKILGNGKISASQSEIVELPEKMSLLGPRLETPIPQNIFNENTSVKIQKLILPQIIGTGIGGQEETNKNPVLYERNSCLENELSFRAAAFANMQWEQIQVKSGIVSGYKWEIGKLFWLPAVKK